MTKKPAWVVDKERKARDAARATVWLFGLHAVRDALANPRRDRLRLILTRNAADRLADALPAADIEPEIADPRRSIPAPCIRAPRWRRARSIGARWRSWPPRRRGPRP
jgi:23S rRNA (guanosine2251-2'-O)-methyltransferase